MNVLFTTAVSLAFGLNGADAMQPRVLLGDSSHCDAFMVRDGHVFVEEVCTKKTEVPKKSSGGAEVSWDGHVATITSADENASREWMRVHSVRGHLSIKRGNLYWDGKRVDLGRAAVSRIDEAIPWQGGVLFSGATVPRKKFLESWPFKGPFFDVREMEPWCVVFFDLRTLKGEDHYFTSFAVLSLIVFPIPD